MKGFIEIKISHSELNMLFNVNLIREIWEQADGRVSFSMVGMDASDFYTTNTSYEGVKNLIIEASGGQ